MNQSEVAYFMKRYEKAEKNLLKKIAKKTNKRTVTAYHKDVLAQVQRELRLVDEFSVKWAAGEIPKAYGDSYAKVWNVFRKAGLGTVQPAFSTAAYQEILTSATAGLTSATVGIGRIVADEIRAESLEAVGQKIITGGTVKEAQKNLTDRLMKKGILGVADKNGRKQSLSSYASMVARTTTREATNKATTDTVTDMGYDLVQMTTTYGACPICVPLEGRVYSVSGKDKRYPSLNRAFPGGFHTIHPNCTHSMVPYFEKYDDDADRIRKESNRPFDEIDKDMQKSIDAYNKDQAVKTARYNDRREWENTKRLLPQDTPKTFSGYRAGKRNNSDKYKSLRKKVLDINDTRTSAGG
jgi:hypothetical protein